MGEATECTIVMSIDELIAHDTLQIVGLITKVKEVI